MAEALGWVEGVEVAHRRGGDRLDETWSADRPSDTITTRFDRWHIGFPRADDTGESEDGYRDRDRRAATEPSFAIGEKARSWDWVYRNGNRGHAAERPASDPAPTLHFGGRSNKVDWVRDEWPAWPATRPATTVAGDPRIFPGPRSERNPDYAAGDGPVSQANPSGSTVRVSLEEAAVLQSFPPDYPFQGSRSKQFEQVGNAVPPLLAHAILSHLLAAEL